MGSEDREGLEELLNELTERISAGQKAEVRIRRLVGAAGAQRRGVHVVANIERALEERGLVAPGLASYWIDSLIEVRRRKAEAPVVDASEAPAADAALTVGSLGSANRFVATIDRQGTLEQARAIMLRDDYSQLAVVSSGPRNLIGAISWQTMALAALTNASFSLEDATAVAVTASPEDDLISCVPRIVEHGFIFVVGRDKMLQGIVTTADLSEAFVDLAEPFFLLGEIERRIRRQLDSHFATDELAAVRDPADHSRPVEAAENLTVGEMLRLLQEPGSFDRLGWPVDRSIFLEALDEVRVVRNEVMHFGADPLDAEQIGKLQNFVRWLRIHDPRP